MFETSRLLLRRYRPSDEEFFMNLFDEYPVLLGIVQGYVLPSLSAHKARLDAMLNCLLFVVIEHKETKKAIGFTLLNQPSGPLERNAEVGIGISEKWWGGGYATEALSWLIEYVFKGLALHRISLGVWSSNERAIRLYEHLGFQREGCIREGVWKEGQYVDKIYMGLLAREYEQQASSKGSGREA